MDRRSRSGLAMLIEAILANETERNIEVSFSHLGRDREFDMTIQKTLYEFDDEHDGPLGTVYIVINTVFLQDYIALVDLVRNDITTALSSTKKPAEL
ncbi:MAG: hypothetical protein VW270_00650 [Candidatus Poseidoniales archaeon]